MYNSYMGRLGTCKFDGFAITYYYYVTAVANKA